MNLTGVVNDDWQGRRAVVSEETMAKAREISRKNTGVGSGLSAEPLPSEMPKNADGERGEDGKVSRRYVKKVCDLTFDLRMIDTLERGQLRVGFTLATA
jgi:hypothetical protein